MDWYLIRDGHHDGGYNMAYDGCLAANPPGLPALRFYSWDPPAVSLGYNQRLNGSVREKLDDAGIDLVRRPTGGRAVYHDSEVTYSVIIPKACALYRLSIHELYYRISRAIASGLNSLGFAVDIETNRHAHSRRYTEMTHCFDSAARFEIKYGGRKIVGSAQRRMAAGTLQHGSILLEDRQSLLHKIFSDDDLFNRAPNVHEYSLQSVFGRPVNRTEVIEAVISGFEHELECNFRQDFDTADVQRSAREKRRDYIVYSSHIVHEHEEEAR